MCAFCNILLQTRVCEINTAVRNKLDIGDLTTVFGDIKRCNTDAKNLGRILSSNKPFQQHSSNLYVVEDTFYGSYRLQLATAS